MKRINPIAFFTRQLAENGIFTNEGMSRQILKRVLAWYGKLLFFEPFRLYELLTKDRKICNHRLEESPIFILGHWRSGTSILHSLLASDPHRGYLHKYISVFPESFLSTEHLLKPLVRTITDSLQTKEEISRISVSWEWDTPGELDIAMITFFSPYSTHWAHVFPRDRFDEYMDKYTFFETATPEEEQGWKETTRYLMNKVAIRNEHSQLYIKSPGNTARISQLLDLYPDAKFVYIHRNPYDVFYSNLKMWKVILKNLSFQQIGREKVEDYILSTYRKLLDNYLHQRHLIPDGNLVEIRFEELVADPLARTREVYEGLSLKGYDRAEEAFRGFINGHMSRPGNRSKYNYDPSVVERINEQWQHSLEEWPYNGRVEHMASE